MSKYDTLISIIMPAYNSERYINESIDSVLAQTYKDWELLILDDGSTDNTLQIINEYVKQDRRVKVIHNKKNIGVSATRNKGIKHASGDLIAFLDSDDIWKSEKLEKQIEVIKKESAEFIFTGASYINEKGLPYVGKFEVPKSITYKKLRLHNVISCSSVLLKKNFFQNIKMENDNMHEDYAVWLRILKLGVVAHGINEPLLIYRISRNSKSGNKIKTIKMTYRVYRFVGINPIGSIYFMIRHVIASLLKYKRIFTEKKEG
jgi:teichuronic acid biosynthesis glycosyltransferase TuaG